MTDEEHERYKTQYKHICEFLAGLNIEQMQVVLTVASALYEYNLKSPKP